MAVHLVSLLYVLFQPLLFLFNFPSPSFPPVRASPCYAMPVSLPCLLYLGPTLFLPCFPLLLLLLLLPSCEPPMSHWNQRLLSL